MQESAPRATYHQNQLRGRQFWGRRVHLPVVAIVSVIAHLGRQIIRSRLLRPLTTPLLPELAAIGCFLALLWISIGIALNYEYRAAETVAVQSTSNLARAFEESTRRTIDEIDQLLLSARAFYSEQGERFDFNRWVRTQTLPDKMAAAIGMADSAGHVFADTLAIPPGVSIADRPHFQAQVDPNHDTLFISAPVKGRVSGQDTLQFTRKLLGPHGEFAGVTVFSLGCVELSRFYETLNLGNGFVALLSTEGNILARGPLVPGLIGSTTANTARFGAKLRQPSGAISFRAPLTGVEYIASFRRLQDYPLIVEVGLDSDTAFRQYWSLRNRTMLTGVAVTLAIGLIGTLWLHQKQRSVASRRALTITLETISQGILMVDARGRVPVANRRALDLLELSDETSAVAGKRAASRATDLARRDAANSTHMLPMTGSEATARANGGASLRGRKTTAYKRAPNAAAIARAMSAAGTSASGCPILTEDRKPGIRISS